MSRVLKPDSGQSLVLQDEGGDSALSIDTSGNTTLAGALTASGLVSLSNGINGVRTSQNVNSTEINLTGSYQDVVTTTITPKSANSKLLVLAVFSAFTSTTGARLEARIKLTASGHTTSYSDTQDYIGYQAGSDTQIMVNIPINYIFTVSNTNLYTIALEGKEDGGTGQANYDDVNGDQQSTLTVLEI
jgi:hypothetical protein